MQLITFYSQIQLSMFGQKNSVYSGSEVHFRKTSAYISRNYISRNQNRFSSLNGIELQVSMPIKISNEQQCLINDIPMTQVCKSTEAH